MLKINRDKLSTNNLEILVGMEDHMKSLPDSVKFQMLKHLPFLEGLIDYRDESYLDKIDWVVTETENQQKLQALYAALKVCQAILKKHNEFLITLDDPDVKRDQDHMGRPIARVTIELWRYSDYTSASEAVVYAKNHLWRIWGEMIPEDLVPTEHIDRTASGGTRGTVRKLPKWTVINGIIKCQR